MYAFITSIISEERGFIIHAFKPAYNAIVKNVVFIRFLFGSPKDIFETPKIVFTFNWLRTSVRAFIVSIASFCWALIVKVNVSIIIFFLSIPYFSAVCTILRAISRRSSARGGIPFSSSVSPTTTPPYFLTRGNMLFIISSLPFTEFISGIPLYILKALSITSLVLLSICKGKSTHACTFLTVSFIISISFISGRPTLTSNTSAPFSTCVIASFNI